MHLRRGDRFRGGASEAAAGGRRASGSPHILGDRRRRRHAPHLAAPKPRPSPPSRGTPPSRPHSTRTTAAAAEPTAWLGLLALLFLLAPLVTTAALVLARNHWLAVALRYVAGVLLMRSSSGLRLRCLARARALQAAVAWAGLLLLAAVGLIVAVYLGTCYSVRGSFRAARQRLRARARSPCGRAGARRRQWVVGAPAAAPSPLYQPPC